MANLQTKSNSVILIKPELKHALAIAAIENNPLVWRYSTLTQAPYSMEQIEEFIRASDTLQSSGQVRFLIAREGVCSGVEGGDIIGCVDLYDYNDVDHSAFVGIIVYPFSLHGKGYGTAAIAALIDMLPSLGVTRLKVEIDCRNEASSALFSKFDIEIIVR